jgi:hypothetical protein
VHRGNKAKIKGCEIIKCITGIEILSADPFILFNTIHNCWENGLQAIAKERVRCDGVVKMNRIYQCRDNGVLLAGYNNFCRLEKNHEISSNRLCGIRVVEGASVVLFGNTIFGNFQ